MPPDHQWHYLTRWEEFLGGGSSRMRAIKEVKVSSEIQQWIRLCIVRQLSLLVEYGKDMSFFLHELLVKTLTLWTNRFLKWRSTWDRRSKTKYLPMLSISDFFMVQLQFWQLHRTSQRSEQTSSAIFTNDSSNTLPVKWTDDNQMCKQNGKLQQNKKKKNGPIWWNTKRYPWILCNFLNLLL